MFLFFTLFVELGINKAAHFMASQVDRDTNVVAFLNNHLCFRGFAVILYLCCTALFLMK
jgi:hypothetical protein